ncbi:ABC transporter substrate-binding protein [Thermoactinomyces mirandus]|uniref:ABC transporter substrate-binding protein n=1 Tax=Thermoactinomyces mirandus TaxID=2756294 RepID=A0A7W1XTZ0_9BACL|nr:ABC transporter substrate-binding protein [Thermoactinomyces mirandus]MBA4603032.1 ABC transporter substrate-binding protein [Thermoactinomyces mirandus]
MKRFGVRLLTLLLAFVFIWGLTGCAAQNGADHQSAAVNSPVKPRSINYPLELKDQAANKVKLEKEPERIVSLMPSNTEILFALGAGEQVVGVTDQDDYPAQARKLPKVGSFKINVEKVVSLKPDLVVANSGNEKEALDQLRNMGIPVLVTDSQSIKGVYEAIHLVSLATNRAREADILVANMEKEARTIYGKVVNIPEDRRAKVWFELDSNLYTVGGDTFMNELIGLAGGRNVAASLKGWPKVSPEQVVKWNPDVILTTYGGVEEIKKREGWQSISAVRENRVYALNPDLLNRPGPRIYQGVEQMAKVLYPEKFGDKEK